jgi:hypothetical protein
VFSAKQVCEGNAAAQNPDTRNHKSVFYPRTNRYSTDIHHIGRAAVHRSFYGKNFTVLLPFANRLQQRYGKIFAVSAVREQKQPEQQ